MASAAMLNSGYKAFPDINIVLFFKVATFLPNLVEIGKKIVERHRFFEIQDGGGRHFEKYFFGRTAILRYEFAVLKF